MRRRLLWPGLAVMAHLVASGLSHARADEAADAGWSGDLPGPVRQGVLQLLSDTGATLSTSGLTAVKGNGMVTVNVDPMGIAGGKKITLSGTVKLGFYTTLNVTSANHDTLVLANVFTDAPGPTVAPTTGNVSINTLSGNVALGGTDGDNTLSMFTGSRLEIKGGHWTITGDNASQSWSAGVSGSSTLALAPGAALGSGGVSICSTFAPRAGTSLTGYLSMMNGATLDLADGTVGTFTVNGKFSGPNGGKITLHFDVGPDGPDQLILSDVSNTNDIKDYVALNLLSDKLTPGTYKLMTLARGTLIENHLGFDFTGDPANHDNIVKTKTIGGYTFTLATIDSAGHATSYTGDYATYTLTIAKAKDQP